MAWFDEVDLTSEEDDAEMECAVMGVRLESNLDEQIKNAKELYEMLKKISDLGTPQNFCYQGGGVSITGNSVDMSPAKN